MFFSYPSDVAAGCPDAVNIQADAPSILGDEGALLEGVIDTLDTVVAHGQQETTGRRNVKLH